MTWVKLTRIDTTEEADEAAKGMGWRNDDHLAAELGQSLRGFYFGDLDDDAVEDSVLPEPVEQAGRIYPIAIIVGRGLFVEEAAGCITPDGKRAYVTEIIYQSLL